MYAILIATALLGDVPMGRAGVGMYNDLATCEFNQNEMQVAGTPGVSIESQCVELDSYESAVRAPGAKTVNAMSFGSWGLYEGRKVAYQEILSLPRDEQYKCGPILKDAADFAAAQPGMRAAFVCVPVQSSHYAQTSY